MMLYRRTLVVANSQQRPDDFWFVTGPVLKSSCVLKMCASAIFAERERKAVWMLLWCRTVRVSCSFELEETSSSHDSMFVMDREPSSDAAGRRCSEDRDAATWSTAARFSSSAETAGRAEEEAGLEGTAPMSTRRTEVCRWDFAVDAYML